MVRKIWYGILILVTVYLEIMYDSSWLLSLLAFELLLAMVMFLLSWYLRMHVRVWLDMKIPVAQKNESFPLELHLENTGHFPVSDVHVVIGYENKYGHYRERRVLDESIGSMGQKTVMLHAASEYCGNIRFFLPRVCVWDYLHLFRRKLKCTSALSVNVLPDIRPVPVEVSVRTRNFPVEGDEYEKEQSGDDPSEIFQIREFRPGDRMQRVHWKMSARMEEMMTKEYSMPRGCKILFLLDGRQKEESLEKMDAFLASAASLSFSMLEAGCLHVAAWYDDSAGRVMRHCIQREQDIYEMLDFLMTAPVYGQEYDIRAAYHSHYPEGVYSTVLYLDTEGNLECNGERTGFSGAGNKGPGLSGFVLEV